ITVYADAVTLLTETEQLLNQKQAVRLSELFIELNWQAYLEKCNHMPLTTPTAIFLMGPTASGKTDLAIQL
ncbi:tRNA delta(2)-isopentenylpyrophosphate transferase, partial [Pasteurella multocida subsp. multocida str. Anand1_buffalo]